MPYRICKSIEVENGHMLSKHPDKCQFPHGHTRKVEIVMESSELDENQMVCDFKIIKTALGEWLDRFDHALCMNGYGEKTATVEKRPRGADFESRSKTLLLRTGRNQGRVGAPCFGADAGRHEYYEAHVRSKIRFSGQSGLGRICRVKGE